MTAAERCPHHGGHCAYSPDDRTRCSYCHRSWSVIVERDGQRRRDHCNEHRRQYARRAHYRALREAAAPDWQPPANTTGTSGADSTMPDDPNDAQTRPQGDNHERTSTR
jgi:hypothetical protein